jgi:hypothetical protein
VELSTTRKANCCVGLHSFPAFYGNRRFNTEFKRALHLSLAWARPIQSTSPDPTSTKSIPILSNYLRLGLPSGLFPSGFPTDLYAFFFSQIRATFPYHFILLDFIIIIILDKKYKSWSSSLCSFLHSPVTSSLFGPNILLSNLFSNNHSLCSSLNIRDQVSRPYRTTGKIIVLYILIFKFFDR